MVPGEGIAETSEDLSTNNVAQQQHTSSKHRTQQPVEEEGSSAHAAATAAAVAVGKRRRQEHRGREVARGDTNRNLPPSHPIASRAGGLKRREGVIYIYIFGRRAWSK